MINKGLIPLFSNSFFLISQFFLLGKDSKEIFFLCCYLLLQVGFFFSELFGSGNFHFSQQSLSFFIFKLFTSSGVSFTFFETSLGPQCINISLSICSFFLKLSKLLYFLFLLFSQNPLLFLKFELSLLFSSIVLFDSGKLFLFFFLSF